MPINYVLYEIVSKKDGVYLGRAPVEVIIPIREGIIDAKFEYYGVQYEDGSVTACDTLDMLLECFG